MWHGLGIGVKGCVCVYLLHTHTPYVSIPGCKYSMLEHVYLCVCLSTPCSYPICNRILAAFLLKPLCPSHATSTIEQPIVYSHSVRYIIHMMHMVFALRTAWEISWVFASVFFFTAPFLTSPRALCFISLSTWWILGCHAESLTLSIILY